MTQGELEQFIKENKVEFLSTPDSQQNQSDAPLINNQEISDFLPVLFGMLFPRQHVTATPTFIPKNFLEQIQLVDDGTNKKAAFYINKEWAEVILNINGLQASHISISLPSGTSSDTTGTTPIAFTPKLIIGVLRSGSTPQYFGLWMSGFEPISMPIGSRTDSTVTFLGTDSSLYLSSLSFSAGTLSYHYKNNGVSTLVADLIAVG